MKQGTNYLGNVISELKIKFTKNNILDDTKILMYIEDKNNIKHYLISNNQNINNNNNNLQYYKGYIKLGTEYANDIENFIWLVKKNQKNKSTYFICTNQIKNGSKLHKNLPRYDKNDKNYSLCDRLFLNVENVEKSYHIKLWHLGQKHYDDQLFTFSPYYNNNIYTYISKKIKENEDNEDNEDNKDNKQLKFCYNEGYYDVKYEFLSDDKVEIEKQNQKNEVIKLKEKHLQGLIKRFIKLFDNVLTDECKNYIKTIHNILEANIDEHKNKLNNEFFNDQKSKLQDLLQNNKIDELKKFILYQSIIKKFNMMFKIKNSNLSLEKIVKINDNISTKDLKFVIMFMFMSQINGETIDYIISYTKDINDIKNFQRRNFYEHKYIWDIDLDLKDKKIHIKTESEVYYLSIEANNYPSLNKELNGPIYIRSGYLRNYDNNFDLTIDKYGNILCLNSHENENYVIEVYIENIHKKLDFTDFILYDNTDVYVLKCEDSDDEIICCSKNGNITKQSKKDILKSSITTPNCFFYAESILQDSNKFYLYTFIDYVKHYVYYQNKDDNDNNDNNDNIILSKINKSQFNILNNMLYNDVIIVEYVYIFGIDDGHSTGDSSGRSRRERKKIYIHKFNLNSE
jgi:hypothetical protein